MKCFSAPQFRGLRLENRREIREFGGTELARLFGLFEVVYWGVENQRITSCGFSGRDFLILSLFS
jgi:hypothetical protein